MASSNAIRLKELEETKRRNTADINYQVAKVKLDQDRLAEEIANNLRNYNINLSKNQITKLANDQLNERETTKILETMRHNLAEELERNRNNMALEDIKRTENAIKRMDVILQAGKPTGKDAKAILTSFFLNQANLKAYGGVDTVPEEVMKWVNNQLTNVDPSYHGEVVKDRSDGIINYGVKKGKVSQIKSGLLAGKWVYKEPDGTTHVFDTQGEALSAMGKGEIPIDFSSSMGPDQDNIKGGINNEITTDQTQTNSPSGNRSAIIESRSNSKGPGEFIEEKGNNNQSSGSSKIIGTDSKRVGPGWGLIS